MYTWRGIVRPRVLSVYGDAGVFGNERGKRADIGGRARGKNCVGEDMCGKKGERACA